MKILNFNSRRGVIKVMAKRDLKATLYGVGIYIVIFVCLVISALAVKTTFIDSVNENTMLVTTNPLSFPLFLCVFISAIYLALIASIALSRERDRGTMEVLFYGPVDSISYISAKFLEHLVYYLVMLVIFVIYFVAGGYLINVGITSGFLAGLPLSLFLVSAVISFGIFLSAITTRVRTSVLVFLIIMIGFVGIEISNTLLSGLEKEKVTTTILYVKSGLGYLNRILEWVSPFSYLNRGLDAVAIGSLGNYLLSLLGSIIYSVILLAIAVLAFERKGVRRV